MTGRAFAVSACVGALLGIAVTLQFGFLAGFGTGVFLVAAASLLPRKAR